MRLVLSPWKLRFPLSLIAILITYTTLAQSPGAEKVLPGTGCTYSGDLNGDNRPDLVVSDWQFPGDGNYRGRVLIYYGTRKGYSKHPETIIEGIQQGEKFGFSLSTAGDINDDGFEDLLVGS